MVVATVSFTLLTFSSAAIAEPRLDTESRNHCLCFDVAGWFTNLSRR